MFQMTTYLTANNSQIPGKYKERLYLFDTTKKISFLKTIIANKQKRTVTKRMQQKKTTKLTTPSTHKFIQTG